MHAVKMPDKSKDIRITLAVDPWKVRRGHIAHRSGSGMHGDRRLKRLRSRSDQRRAAMGGGVKGAERGLQDQKELDHRRPVPWPQWGLDDVARGGEVQVSYGPGALR